MHALEKLPGAWKASQYRPLTVFSIIYRTWSSIRAKETLAYLGRFVTDQITGNIPGRACTDLWLSIQLELEEANANASQMVGVVADLVKAYNLLPRRPLLAIGLHLGLPRPIIRAWSNALAQLTRAFVVRGTVGPPLTSSTGFAEGCGLSCSAMLICNITLARWLYIRFSSVRLWSYVDNLELTTNSIEAADHGLRLMTQFCELLDLQLDHAKTYYWANQAEARAQARADALSLQSSTRDLGAHMEYGRKTTNHVLRKRLEDMPRVWNALAKSPAPYRQKVHALRTKGWPQALAAGSSAHLGDTHVRTLRTGACKGIRAHAPGVSPMAHLSLVEHPLTDPGCHLLVHTVLTFRRYAKPAQVLSIVDSILRDWTELPARPGPCHVLLDRLHAIGWSWAGHGWLHDHEGYPVDLFHGSLTDLRDRLLDGWQSFAQRCVSRRQTFQGISWAHAPFTMEKARSWTPHQLGLLRKTLNGTFFTADTQLHNSKAHTLTCKFCGQPDSQHHRFWDCAHFEHVRPFPWLVQKVREGGLPKCLTYHGWIGIPPSVRAFHQALMELPDLTDSFEQIPFVPRDLFVDGSCSNPTCAYTRIAGWGLVAAHPDDPDLFWPLAQSLVPGRRQTSVRAEILAATSALRYAARSGTPIRIWSDNAQVVDTLRQALADPDTCRLSPKDQDLLTTLLEVARQVRQLPVTVHKIASHQCKTGTDWVEWWAFTGNDHADHCATWSLKYPQALVKLWQQAISDLDAARVLRDQVHSTMIKISEYALISDIPLDAADPPPLEHALTRTEATIAPLPRLPQTATHKLVGDGWERLTEWSNSLIKAEAEIIFVPWLYMYIDYVLHTNSGGIQPSNAYSRWTWLDRETAGQHPVVLRVKWLRLLLLRVHRLEQRALSSLYTRPSSQVVRFWAHCIAIRIDQTRFKMVEQHIQKFKAALLDGKDVEILTI